MGLVVLVPQGAEYQAVQRGLRQVPQADRDIANLDIVAIPAGLQPIRNFLDRQPDNSVVRSAIRVLVMGLCGSLDPALAVGDAVMYQSCQDSSQSVWQCDTEISSNAKRVKGVCSDRLIATAADKQLLRAQSGCDVVDMEGTAILEFFDSRKIPVTVLRVVSDNATGDIPDLSGAIDRDGNLQSVPLAIGLIRSPLKGLRLIRGALRGLKALTQLAATVVANLER
ncbi:phosphorylase [filamentous cyanobacterium LEGE 11480]|uniref:Phosphorylase n=1 Tax=Romeriopsis navalis LEGE 11480 TaxID=2777977 RepID=A0A928Z2X3_9CYAN|nr:hypothetical protein [Romeriopsis navalis]MBE9030019.1 phosphorylase [Romeriopsis navalis LEGE 11480]